MTRGGARLGTGVATGIVDACMYCSGTKRDDHGNTCVFCNGQGVVIVLDDDDAGFDDEDYADE